MKDYLSGAMVLLIKAPSAILQFLSSNFIRNFILFLLLLRAADIAEKQLEIVSYLDQIHHIVRRGN